MENDIVEQIRKKTIGATKETRFDIRDITNEAPFKIEGITYLISSHQFWIDPTPWDSWLVVEGKLRKGHEIIDILKEKKIVPQNKKEALNIAKLIVFAEGSRTKVFPDFPDRMGVKPKKPRVTFKEGIYEVVMYVAEGPWHFMPVFKRIIRLGKDVYESKAG